MVTILSSLPSARSPYGEKVVAKWVEDHLDDVWTGFFNVNWLPVPETDVLLLHPSHGVSAIEVKGHSLDEILSFGPNHAEFSDGQKKHPALQARQASQRLSSWAKGLGTTTANGVPWISSTSCFPRIRRADFLERFDNPEVIRQAQSMIFEDDMESIGSFIGVLQSARLTPPVGGVPPRISRDLKQQVSWLKDELEDSLKASGTSSSSPQASVARVGADGVAAAIAEEFPWGQEGTSKVVFRGLPGTGKTSILLEIARQHARQGANVLYVTYNKTLAANVRALTARMSNEDVEFGHGPEGGWKITALDLWQLYAYVTEVNLPQRMTSNRYKRFEKKYDRALGKALTKFTERFDTVLIDEAQDLSDPGFRYALGLRDPDASVFVALGDGQLLYRKDVAPELRDWLGNVDHERHLFRSFRKSHASDLVIKAFIEHGTDLDHATRALEAEVADEAQKKATGTGRTKGTIDLIRNAGKINLREREGDRLQPAIYQWELHEYLRKWREESPDGVVDALVIFRRREDIDSSAVRVTLDGGSIPYSDLLKEDNRRNPTPERGVRLTTFHSSRGLRAKYAIVFGFDQMPDLPHDHHLAAIALSRATDETVVVVAKDSKSKYLHMLRGIHDHARSMKRA
jgi:nucleoside-triphosphatase THEP1